MILWPLIDPLSAIVTHGLQLTIVESEGGKREVSDERCVEKNVLFCPGMKSACLAESRLRQHIECVLESSQEVRLSGREAVGS